MSRKGFTLIELLVVISIIALLASVVMAALNSARDKGRLGAGKYFAAQVDHAASDQAAALWDFDECAGSTVADRSGNGNTVSLLGGSSIVSESPLGQGCSGLFDGTSGRGDAGSTALITGTNPFTLALWFRTDRVSAGYDTLISKSYYTGVTDVGMILTFLGPGNNVLYFRGLSSTSGCIGLSTPSVMPVGVWKHVTVTSDGTTASMYIDGAVVRTGAVACGIDSASGYNLILGGRAQLSGFFKGALDSVHVFSKSLTASEVGKIYASEAPKFKLADGVR